MDDLVINVHNATNRPERVSPLMPTQLSTYAVCYRCHKFSTKTEFCTQFSGKLLRAVVLLRHIPLKLVGQRDVTNMDV